MNSSHHLQYFFQPYSVRLIWLQKSCHRPKSHYDFQAEEAKGPEMAFSLVTLCFLISKANLWEFPLLIFCYDAWARSKSWLFVTMREAGEMSLS